MTKLGHITLPLPSQTQFKPPKLHQEVTCKLDYSAYLSGSFRRVFEAGHRQNNFLLIELYITIKNNKTLCQIKCVVTYAWSANLSCTFRRKFCPLFSFFSVSQRGRKKMIEYKTCRVAWTSLEVLSPVSFLRLVYFPLGKISIIIPYNYSSCMQQFHFFSHKQLI